MIEASALERTGGPVFYTHFTGDVMICKSDGEAESDGMKGKPNGKP